MSSKELLFQLYKKFYEQRSVLNGAPDLTLDIEHQTLDSFDEDKADTELNQLTSYMMGVQDVKQLPWNEALTLLDKYYGNQPQWQRLLLDYFSCSLEKEKENIVKQQTAFFQEVIKQFEHKNEGEKPSS